MKEIIITSSVLILGILLIRRIFRGKVSSRLLYALWLLAALRLALPVSVQMDLGPLSRLQPTELVRQAEQRSGLAEGRLEEPIQVSLSGSNPLFRFFVSRAAGEAIGGADGPTSVFIAGKLGFARMDVLRFVWKAGMAIVAVWMTAVNFLFFLKLRRARKEYALPEELTELVKKHKNLRIYTADHLASPCLYGFPGWEAVYLTPDVAEDADKLRHVMVHELVHRKHGDSFWAVLRSVLVAVYWFHPLVWVAAVCSKRDCELACDESALALLGEEERISYGETLLSIITRRGRFSDLACTATTMTGSAKSVKERIQFIVKKPGVFYAAIAALVVLTAVICLFVFTRGFWSDGVMVDKEEGLTVTGADMQIHLPASIGGISGCILEGENEDIVVYHQSAGREVGRFSRLSLKDALALVDAGREVTPLGDEGDNYLLRAYLGEPLSRTEHIYTPAEKETGALWHEDVYLPNESIIVSDDPIDSTTQHTYTPAEEEAEAEIPEASDGVPGTDSNDDTTYILEGDGNPMLSEDWEVTPLEESVDYLPNEEITVTTYQPRNVNVDELEGGCYIYVKADFDRVPEKYLEEMNFIDSELKAAGEGAVILSLNSKRREALFDALTENRTPYIGDNTRVGALLEALPLPLSLNRVEGFRLQTIEHPYSLRFSYEMSTDILTKEDEDTLYFNAAMLFYAVGNLEEITMDVQNPGGSDKSHFCVYEREEMEGELPTLRDADYEDNQAFRESLEELYPAIEAYLSGGNSLEK